MSTTVNTTSTACPCFRKDREGHHDGCPNHPRRRPHRELEISARHLEERDAVEVVIGTTRAHLTYGESERLRDQISELLAADGTIEEPLPVGEVDAE